MTSLNTLFNARKIILTVPILAALAAGAAWVGTAAAQAPAAQSQGTAANVDAKRKEKQLAAGEAEAKQLLLLMDRNQNGKVSKEEFMSFMEAEFARLDVNKDGQLDVNELIQSKFVPRGGVRR